MRFFLPLLTCIFCSLVLLSCKKDKEEATPRPDANKITLWAGQDTVITLAGASAQYTVVSGNTNIARVALQDNRLHITTDIPGTTTIRITDQANHTDSFRLEAISVAGVWRRRVVNGTLQNNVTVDCADALLTQTLKDELKEEVIKADMLYGLTFADYSAAYEEARFGGARSQGTYSYHNLKLTLTRNNTTEEFTIRPDGPRKMGLEQDLTVQYKTLYPTKGITRVTIIRYFNFVPLL